MRYPQDLGINFFKTTIAKIFKKYGIKPAPEIKNDSTWSKIIETHKAVLMIFLGVRSLRYALKQYLIFHNTERHHQGIGNMVPFPVEFKKPSEGELEGKTRLGGLLRQYRRKDASKKNREEKLILKVGG